jgi:peptidoglycan/LPS O-acetylase OafA/YrhL
LGFVVAVTYTMNSYDSRGWPLGHLWSLAVEKFYLLWPWTLRALGPSRSTRWLLVLVAVVPILRLPKFARHQRSIL